MTVATIGIVFIREERPSAVLYDVCRAGRRSILDAQTRRQHYIDLGVLVSFAGGFATCAAGATLGIVTEQLVWATLIVIGGLWFLAAPITASILRGRLLAWADQHMNGPDQGLAAGLEVVGGIPGLPASLWLVPRWRRDALGPLMDAYLDDARERLGQHAWDVFTVLADEGYPGTFRELEAAATALA